MKWCKIDNKYLLYLKNFETRIPDFEYSTLRTNGGTKKLFKPFFYMLKDCGSYCFVGQVNHYNPIKHGKLRDMLDFKKVYDLSSNNPLCVVNLNYVFPVPKTEIIDITSSNISKERDFDNNIEKSQYINLLNRELKSINSMDLEYSFDKLYNLKAFNPKHKVSQRCFDYSFLEEKCELWEKYPDIKNNLIDTIELKKLNDHIRHKDAGYNTSMIEGKHFICNTDLYRIDQIELKSFGLDSAILIKMTASGEENYIDNNFTSDAKFNLHLQKLDSKSLSNFKNIKSK